MVAQPEAVPMASPCCPSHPAQTWLCSAVWLLWVHSPWESPPQPYSQR